MKQELNWGLNALLELELRLQLGALHFATGLVGAACVLRLGALKQELNIMVDAVLELLLGLTAKTRFVTGSFKKGALAFVLA